MLIIYTDVLSSSNLYNSLVRYFPNHVMAHPKTKRGPQVTARWSIQPLPVGAISMGLSFTNGSTHILTMSIRGGADKSLA